MHSETLRSTAASNRLTGIYVDKDVLSIDHDRKNSKMGILRIDARSAANIELPVMSRTTENLFRQSAFTQTTLLVRTGISVCVEMVINVDQQNMLTIHL